MFLTKDVDWRPTRNLVKHLIRMAIIATRKNCSLRSKKKVIYYDERRG
jgi:hypothetical protein